MRAPGRRRGSPWILPKWSKPLCANARRTHPPSASPVPAVKPPRADAHVAFPIRPRDNTSILRRLFVGAWRGETVMLAYIVLWVCYSIVGMAIVWLVRTTVMSEHGGAAARVAWLSVFIFLVVGLVMVNLSTLGYSESTAVRLVYLGQPATTAALAAYAAVLASCIGGWVFADFPARLSVKIYSALGIGFTLISWLSNETCGCGIPSIAWRGYDLHQAPITILLVLFVVLFGLSHVASNRPGVKVVIPVTAIVGVVDLVLVNTSGIWFGRLGIPEASTGLEKVGLKGTYYPPGYPAAAYVMLAAFVALFFALSLTTWRTALGAKS